MPYSKRGLSLFGSLIGLILLITVTPGSSAQQIATGPSGDYGDAPDALTAGYSHVDAQKIGSFPSTFRTSTDLGYILHRFPQERVYLGQTVTTETNALLVDRDLDDGWVPGSFFTCSRAQLTVGVTVPREATASPIYLNVLFDWDHDGRWSDFSLCPSQRGKQVAEEWAIRNLPLHQQPYSLTPGFSGLIDLPEIITGPVAGELWMRVTITTEPVDESRFIPAEFGGHGWSGQGDFLYGESEDYFSCLLSDPKQPMAGCPSPMGNQPPIDPPPGKSRNNAPVAANDTAVLCEGGSAVIEVLANDSDPENDRIILVDIIQQPAHGTASINSNGTVTYLPDAGFSGEDSFIYTICDSNGLCDSATVTITVSSPPDANDDTGITDEDTSISLNILANDSDPVGPIDVTAVRILSGPAHGSVNVNSNGTVTYIPSPNFSGTDTFTYTTADKFSCPSNAATVTIQINPVNDPPVAENDTVTTDEDTNVTIDVLANDTDIDGTVDPSTVRITTGPDKGSVKVNLDGSITYTPNSNFTGTDTFTYQVCDNGSPMLCDTATVTVTINPANDAPVANDDSATTNEDSPVNITVLANDSDVDGDTLSVTSVTQPANGTATINPDGTVTYTPDPNFNGTDTFTYTISDGHGGTDTATVTVTVNPVNDAPVARDDSAATNEDSPRTISILTNDSDVDGTVNPSTVTIIGGPNNGSITINPSGTVIYTPDANFNGTDTFRYQVCDNGSPVLCDTATVTVTVNPVNDAPIANDDNPATGEDTPVVINVLENDSDPDGDTLTTSSVTQPSHGSATINPDGTVTYTPDPNFSGTDTFTYTISDGHGGIDTATVTVIVTSTNDPPVANNDHPTAPEDTPTIIDVLANDSDPDGNQLTVSGVTQPAHGTVTINPDGTVTYTPNANFNGTDAFTYQVCDNGSPVLCDTATVTVTVNPVNDAPSANNDSTITNEDTSATIPVLANDTDVDGDALTITGNSQGAHGTVTCNATQCTYTPSTNFNGTDTFTYTISDGHGGTDSATVTVTVSPVNDAPEAVNDSTSTNEDSSTTILVLGNDTDVDGDSLTVTSFAQPSNGSINCTAGGTCTYTPDTNFNGIDTFTCTISDGHGGTDTATVSVTVNPLNDAPIANNDSAAATEDTPTTITVLSNDSDPDGNTLTVASVTQPANGSATINPNGTVTYTPNANFNGTDSFTYQVCDNGNPVLCDTATVTVAVHAANDAPTANNDSTVTNEDSNVTIPVLGNDSDVDGDTLIVTSVTQPANGTATINPAGTVTYTPDSNFNGTDTFTYTISDGHGGSDTATVIVTIDPVNDAPIANNDSASIDENTAVTVAVLSNDTDVDGDTLTVTGLTQGTNGTVSCTATQCTYTPSANFNGTDTFTYTISDGRGGSDTATVTVTVNPVNNAPNANDDSVSTDEDTATTIHVLSNDTDADGDSLTITGNTQGTHGSVDCTTTQCIYTPSLNFHGTDTFTYTICDPSALCDTATVSVVVTSANDSPIANDDTATANEDSPQIIAVLANDTDPDGDPLTVTSATQPANGSVTINPNGTVTYTPNANFNGTDSFTYQACDNGNPVLCDTATVTVTVNPVNDSPVANNDSTATNEDTPVTVDVLANDSDIDGDSLTITSFTQPSSGSVNCLTGGICTYTPSANFNGIDTFTYTISDGHGGTDTATVTVTANPVNDAPNAVNDSAATNEDTPTTINVLGNDSDMDGSIDPSTVTLITNPTNGSVTVNPDGTVTYTPNANFNGTDTFTYQVCDNGSPVLCDTATVTVTVNSVNDAPVAVNDSATTNEDSPVTVDVLANDSDVDGDTLTVTSVTQPADGHVTINPNGSVAYTPNTNFNGTDTFTYTINDGHGGTDTATVTVTVNPVNDAPDAVNDSATTNEDSSTTILVLANDTDVDGDSLTVISFTQPINGSLNCTAGGTCTYTPDTNFNGTDTFTYTISDGHGGTDTATVTVTVSPANDAPDANDDAATTNEETPVTVSVLTNDIDIDGDTLTITGNSQGAHGTVTCNATQCTYTPSTNFNGTDTFTYTISDGHGGTDSATVTVTVSPVNDAPEAVNDSATTNEDSSTTILVLTNDTDVDGDTLSVTGNTQGAHGTTSCTTSQCTYTPNANFNGIDTFTYTISDGHGGTDTATVAVTVNPVNDAPDAVNDSATTNEDTPVTVSVLVNDTDIDGDTLSVSGITQPTHGTVLFNLGGLVTYSPNANFNGTDAFTYTACDPHGLCDTATVTVTVNPVNDAPDAVNDTINTNEDTAVIVDVLANDTDIEGDTLAVTSSTQGSHGTVSCTTAGACTYTPNVNFNGTDTFTYTISDGHSGTDTATVTIIVNPVNDAPDAVNDSISTNEDTAVNIAVLANDTDIDGDSLTVTGNTQGTHGSVSCTASVCTYTPSTNFNGTDTFTYTTSDGHGGTDTATVTVTVNPVNDAPVAEANGPYSCSVGGSTSLSSAGSSDVDGTIVSYQWDLDNNGTFETTGQSPTFNCTTVGTYTVRLRVTDNDGATGTDTATVTVQPPAADLGITKTVVNTTTSDGRNFEGDTLQYTLTLTNFGPSNATGVQVTDLLPSSVTFVSASPSQGTYTGGSGLWAVGSLANGSSVTLTITTTIKAGTAGSAITNTAAITVLNESDPNSGNNSASASLPVSGLVDAFCGNQASLGFNWINLAINSNVITITLHGTNTGQGGTGWIRNTIVQTICESGDCSMIASSAPALPDTWNIGSQPPGWSADRTFTITMQAGWHDITIRATTIREDCKPPNVGQKFATKIQNH